MKVNVLCLGLQEYKSRSLLLPLIRFNRQISKTGINLEVFHSDSDELSNCDVVMIEDRYYVSGKKKNPKLTTEQISNLQELRSKTNQVLWFDTSDSTKIKVPSVFPYVDKYCKKQLLADRELYREQLFESRLFSEYYYQMDGGISRDGEQAQNRIQQLSPDADLSKLAVFWNVGQAIYSPAPDLAWKILDKFPHLMCEKIPWSKLLECARLWMPVNSDRSTDISGRFSTTYGLDGVELHRKLFVKHLQHKFDSDAVNSLAYWRELQNSKVLLSPFGYGEVCLRDFEGFMSGCVVVKPHMDHLETWPPVYENDETIVPVSWDMSDLEERVDQILQNYDEYKSIAEEGQKRYKKYIVGSDASELFVGQLESLL